MAWWGESEKHPGIGYNAEENGGKLIIVFSRKMDDNTEFYGKYEPSEKAKTSCLPDKYHWERNSSENKRQIRDSTLQYEKTGKTYRPLNEINTTRKSMFTSHTR